VKRAYEMGDVVITLGTGRLSRPEEEALGLVGEHDYAVLDLDATRESRRFLVKNPWCDGLVWKGSGSSAKIDPLHEPLLSLARMQVLPQSQYKDIPTGSFWISLEDVAQNFESMYLNWNPHLFAHRQDHHFVWKLPGKHMAQSFADNPQYSFRSPAGGTVWVLLSRHFADAELDIARKRSGSLAAVSKQLGFMSLYIFDNGGRRVQLSDGFIYRGPYVDSPQTLSKFTASKGKPYTVVLAQQDLPLPTYSFTLSFFSVNALDVEAAGQELKYFNEESSAWTRRTAGGNASSPSYSQNPQFNVIISRPTPLTILLCSEKSDIPVHVDLAWSQGERVNYITVKDLVGTSGDYRRGCAFVRVPTVDAGTYTIVCSTFEAGQLSEFTIRLGSMVPVAVNPVAANSAGRLRTRLPTLLFREGQDRWQCTLSAERLTRATIVATYGHHVHSGQRVQQHPTISIRICLVYGSGPDESLLAISGDGEFREATLGLRSPEFDIEPERLRFSPLWLVVEQMGSSQNSHGLEVEVLSDGPLVIGGWQTLDR
jgi:calpain-7